MAYLGFSDIYGDRIQMMKVEGGEQQRRSSHKGGGGSHGRLGWATRIVNLHEDE